MNDTPINNNIDENNLSNNDYYGEIDIVGTPKKVENEFYSQDIVGGPNWDINLKGAPYESASLQNKENFETALKEEYVDIPTLSVNNNTELKNNSNIKTNIDNVVNITNIVTNTTTESTTAINNSSSETDNYATETSNIKYVSTKPTETTKTKTSSITELQRVVTKLEKLEKMINPNSKKSLILWEEDNSFKNLITSIVNYANVCDTENEFPIELLDKLKALSEDVTKQITEGEEKVKELHSQSAHNTRLSQMLSEAYLSAMAGASRANYESQLAEPEIAEYIEQLDIISTALPDTEDYSTAEKIIKSKITNLENSVHIAIDLERTTSKGRALKYISSEVIPAVDRLQKAYDEKYKVSNATEIIGEEAVTSLAVKKSLSEKIYDTFVKPFAKLFKRKNKSK